MPLTRDPDSVIIEDTRVGVGFSMLNGAKRVVVWVDRGALRVLQDKSLGSTERTAFDRHLERLEAIAAANYDFGIIERDGSTIIRRDDVEWLS